MPGPRLHFTAAEASGDLLGREVITEINQLAPDAEIAGIGGRAMAKAGIQSPFDIAPLSVL
ncbi:MAG: lipid-A-disaccharide synthase, partial [Hyphomonadaceae bacterium]